MGLFISVDVKAWFRFPNREILAKTAKKIGEITEFLLIKMHILSKFHGETLISEANRAPFHVTPGSTLWKRIRIANFLILRDSFAHIFKNFAFDFLILSRPLPKWTKQAFLRFLSYEIHYCMKVSLKQYDHIGYQPEN